MRHFIISLEKFLYHFFFWVGGVVCHQQPERSLFFHDRPLPFCARCTAVYVSIFILSVVLFAVGKGKINSQKHSAAEFDRERRAFLTGSLTGAAWMLPLGIDGLGNMFKLWNSSAFVRMLTGIGMGWGLLVIFLYVMGYDPLSGRFIPPFRKKLWIASVASLAGVSAVYRGMFPYGLIVGGASVFGLITMLAALAYLLLTKAMGMSGERCWVLCLCAPWALLFLLHSIKALIFNNG